MYGAVNGETETLFEIMVSAERFCFQIESLLQDIPRSEGADELRLKIVQCRAFLREIRSLYEDERLSVKEPTLRENFRQLITGLMWVAFYARETLDFKLFRQVVMIESAYTYLLNLGYRSFEPLHALPMPLSAVSGPRKLKPKHLLYATLIILVLNLIAAVIGPRWKQMRHEAKAKQTTLNGQTYPPTAPSRSDHQSP